MHCRSRLRARPPWPPPRAVEITWARWRRQRAPALWGADAQLITPRGIRGTTEAASHVAGGRAGEHPLLSFGNARPHLPSIAIYSVAPHLRHRVAAPWRQLIGRTLLNALNVLIFTVIDHMGPTAQAAAEFMNVIDVSGGDALPIAPHLPILRGTSPGWYRTLRGFVTCTPEMLRHFGWGDVPEKNI